MHLIPTAVGFVLISAGLVLRYQVAKAASGAVGGDHTTIQKHIRSDPLLRNKNSSGYVLQVAGVIAIGIDHFFG